MNILIPWYDHISGSESIDELMARRRREVPRLTGAQLEALWQLRMTVWDGYLISKIARDQLVDKGLASRCNGWQVLTREGMAVLSTYGLMENEQYGIRGAGGDKLWTLTPTQFARLRREGWVIG